MILTYLCCVAAPLFLDFSAVDFPDETAPIKGGDVHAALPSQLVTYRSGHADTAVGCGGSKGYDSVEVTIKAGDTEWSSNAVVQNETSVLPGNVEVLVSAGASVDGTDFIQLVLEWDNFTDCDLYVEADTEADFTVDEDGVTARLVDSFQFSVEGFFVVVLLDDEEGAILELGSELGPVDLERGKTYTFAIILSPDRQIPLSSMPEMLGNVVTLEITSRSSR